MKQKNQRRTASWLSKRAITNTYKPVRKARAAHTMSNTPSLNAMPATYKTFWDAHQFLLQGEQGQEQGSQVQVSKEEDADMREVSLKAGKNLSLNWLTVTQPSNADGYETNLVGEIGPVTTLAHVEGSMQVDSSVGDGVNDGESGICSEKLNCWR
jgi:hypothetical protein